MREWQDDGHGGFDLIENGEKLGSATPSRFPGYFVLDVPFEPYERIQGIEEAKARMLALVTRQSSD